MIGQVKDAFRALNPEEVQADAERRVTFGVLAENHICADEVCDFLFPPPRQFLRQNVLRIRSEDDIAAATVGFAEHGLLHPAHFYTFDPQRPHESADDLLDDHESHWLPLAKSFPGLRRQVSERLIWKIAKENTMFTVATSLPHIVPTPLALPLTVGEYASDTAVLTTNQVRLSFLLAAAHGKKVGYDRQTLQVGSIVGGAFGWRALARGLVSKIPAGGGSVAKGIIAFAGTYAVGRSLEFWYREGSRLGRRAINAYYEDARRMGRETVEGIVESAKALASRGAPQAVESSLEADHPLHPPS